MMFCKSKTRIMTLVERVQVFFFNLKSITAFISEETSELSSDFSSPITSGHNIPRPSFCVSNVPYQQSSRLSLHVFNIFSKNKNNNNRTHLFRRIVNIVSVQCSHVHSVYIGIYYTRNSLQYSFLVKNYITKHT